MEETEHLIFRFDEPIIMGHGWQAVQVETVRHSSLVLVYFNTVELGKDHCSARLDMGKGIFIDSLLPIVPEPFGQERIDCLMDRIAIELNNWEHRGFANKAGADAQHIQILYDIHQFVRCGKCDTPCDPNGVCWECGKRNKPDPRQWGFTSAETRQIHHTIMRFNRIGLESLTDLLKRTNLGDLTDDEIVWLAEKLEGKV